MFIVAMTLAVLASVGIYALAAAASELRTSGNERQSAQSHYLAEYGVIGAAHEISAGNAQWYLGVMLSAPDTLCMALPGVPSTASPTTRACRRVGSKELAGTWSSPFTVAYAPGKQAFTDAPGSLGPIPMEGDFFVELTDPSQTTSPARYALGLNLCFIGLAATSTGITRPMFVNVTDPVATIAGEGVEVQRARFVAGPIQCPR
jgi:hypothetical protein